MAKNLIIALDQGTTSSRAIAFNARGEVVASASADFPQHFPQSGWVEHDPEDIWQSSLKVLRAVLQQVDSAQVAAVGITNQRETSLLWERRSLAPVGNAIVWQDRRTAALCEQISAADQDYIRARTGLLTDPYFCASKIAWMLANRGDDLQRRARAGELAFGTVDSYLISRFTGGRRHVSDVSNCSRTMLFDIHDMSFSAKLCSIWDIPMELLPEPCANAADYCVIDKELLGVELPVLACVGDQQAALVGQACTQPGMVKSTYGTGAFLLMNTGTQARASSNNLLTTVAYQVGGETHYALEGAIFQAGTIIKWLLEQLELISTPGESAQLAASLEDNDGVYLVPAFTGLGAPWWDAHARGLICGLSRGSGKAHIARAALESIAYQSHDLIDAMAADAGAELSKLRVDGGVSANDWLLQFLADICGCSVDRPQVIETTALGSAALAALQAGLLSSLDDIAAMRLSSAEFQPNLSADTRANRLAGWRQAVTRTLTQRADAL